MKSEFCKPEQGGCWFCSTIDDGNDWLESLQFDTLLHYKCLIKADPSNPEVQIMKEEFGLNDK